MTYNMLLKMILKGGYDKEDMLNKLDTFYATGRITQAQYMELLEMVLAEKEASIWDATAITVKNGQFEPFKAKTDGGIYINGADIKKATFAGQ